jgi:hypothetical protein
VGVRGVGAPPPPDDGFVSSRRGADLCARILGTDSTTNDRLGACREPNTTRTKLRYWAEDRVAVLFSCPSCAQRFAEPLCVAACTRGETLPFVQLDESSHGSHGNHSTWDGVGRVELLVSRRFVDDARQCCAQTLFGVRHVRGMSDDELLHSVSTASDPAIRQWYTLDTQLSFRIDGDSGRGYGALETRQLVDLVKTPCMCGSAASRVWTPAALAGVVAAALVVAVCVI